MTDAIPLDQAILAVAAAPADLQARANLAVALDNLGVPEADQVWRGTAILAGARGHFFVALALARKFLTGQMQTDVLDELARRYGAGRPRQGPIFLAESVDPIEFSLAEDPEEQIWQGVRLGTDVEALKFPKFARMPAIPIFEELPAGEFVALAREVDPVGIDAGQKLMAQDSVERFVYVLVSGQAHAITKRPDGVTVDLGVHAGPTVLGEMALVTEVPRRSTVTAISPGLAWRINAERLIELGQSHPALVARLSGLVKRRLLADLLRASEVLSSVENSEALVQAFAVRNYPAGTEIFPQGAPAPGLYFMLYGSAEVRVQAKDGTDKKVAELTEGDAFGEMSLLSGDPTTASVRTPTGAIALHLAPADYQRIRGNAADLTAGLGQLADFRRGVLNAYLTAPPLPIEAEVIEEIDDSWILALDDELAGLGSGE